VNLCVGIGILALDAKVLNELPDLAKGKKEFDITKDLVPHLYKKGALLLPTKPIVFGMMLAR